MFTLMSSVNTTTSFGAMMQQKPRRINAFRTTTRFTTTKIGGTGRMSERTISKRGDDDSFIIVRSSAGGVLGGEEN